MLHLISMLFMIMVMIPLVNSWCCYKQPGDLFTMRCCAYGNPAPCNIFCCNCDTQCMGYDDCIFDQLDPRKGAPSAESNLNATIELFRFIDANSDGFLSYSELVFKINKHKFENDWFESDWFEKLDTDHDGFVSPKEFDRDLA